MWRDLAGHERQALDVCGTVQGAGMPDRINRAEGESRLGGSTAFSGLADRTGARRPPPAFLQLCQAHDELPTNCEARNLLPAGILPQLMNKIINII